jgi:hypothetical protein
MERRSGIDPRGEERFQGEENAHAQVHGNATASSVMASAKGLQEPEGPWTVFESTRKAEVSELSEELHRRNG